MPVKLQMSVPSKGVLYDVALSSTPEDPVPVEPLTHTFVRKDTENLHAD